MSYRAIRSGSCAAPSPSRRRAIPRGAHGLSPRAMSARTGLLAIRVIHQESRATSGSPSIWNALLKQGHRIGEPRGARLMRQDGIRAKTVKQWRATPSSQHRFPLATHTLNRPFTVTSPNRVWAGDLTYV
jgi:putative transposase